jgi:hypothetical protein
MKYLAILTLTLAVLISGCRRDRTDNSDNSTSSDNNNAENLYSDLYKIVHDVSSNTNGIRDYSIGCIDTVIVDTTANPRTVLVDFGTDDCVGDDGKVRKGQLLITYTGRYRTPGTVITVTPSNYTVNGFLLQGTKTITNMGNNTSGQPYFNISVTGTITAPNNAYSLSYTSTRVRTWTQGYDTATIWDDVYSISGTASGTNRQGEPYTAAITSPLIAKVGCAWIVSGIVEIVPQGRPTRTINFGNGDCNAGFTVTVNSQVYTYLGGN